MTGFGLRASACEYPTLGFGDGLWASVSSLNFREPRLEIVLSVSGEGMGEGDGRVGLRHDGA